ncbi:MAG: RtcB family protein [Desulfosarcinaceae bacterium]|nr:RtcB family protein [Desulfosarcinaceae bacterium]
MDLRKVSANCWELPRSGGMRVPGRVYTNAELLTALKREAAGKGGALQQVANVAHLPGIVGASMAMPDIHWGYGFPIGGVAAFDWEEGVISPGGVGYDINCGVRLAGTQLEARAVAPQFEALADALYRAIPAGVGTGGRVKLSAKEERRVLTEGSRWAIEQGFGHAQDIEHTEDGGCLPGADPEVVSARALKRGAGQLGTLGSGNHFLELGVVDAVFAEAEARAFGLFEGQLTVLLHTGSRGFGYQVCDDFLAGMTKAMRSSGLKLPDRQLACAPIQSSTGQRYLAAMACAANYAWANRQVLMHLAEETLQRTLGMGPRDLGLRLVYDLCHNIAKKEVHTVAGREQTLCVHRKGATRAFAPGHPALGPAYRQVGQPIIIPGDMGTASYVLVGTEGAMGETFGSTCHGAGRVLSRKKAKQRSRGRQLHRELADRGVTVRWTGRATLAEEMPEAYKDIEAVVDVVHRAGISRKVARLKPLVVVKG